VQIGATPKPTKSVLQQLNDSHGVITKMSVAAFEKARSASLAGKDYPSRYTAAVQAWLGLSIDCRWSPNDQAALDAWRHKTWPNWTDADCSGSAGIESLTALAAAATKAGKGSLKVVA
jgi:hypothetical protein